MSAPILPPAPLLRLQSCSSEVASPPRQPVGPFTGAYRRWAHLPPLFSAGRSRNGTPLPACCEAPSLSCSWSSSLALQVTHDISHLTCADFLRAPGVQTPLIVRFSTVSSGGLLRSVSYGARVRSSCALLHGQLGVRVLFPPEPWDADELLWLPLMYCWPPLQVIHERGSPETLRDPRGFAVKFYTRCAGPAWCLRFRSLPLPEWMPGWGMLHRLQQTRGIQQPQPWSGAARRSANPCMPAPLVMCALLLCLLLDGSCVPCRCVCFCREGNFDLVGNNIPVSGLLLILLMPLGCFGNCCPCPSRGLPWLRDAGAPAAAPRPAPAPQCLVLSCAVLSCALPASTFFRCFSSGTA